MPTSLVPFTSVWHKENFKYEVIPFNSNVPRHFKLMAGISYFCTARSHTNSRSELKNQLKVVHAIIKFLGFPIGMIKQMNASVLWPTSKPDKSKKCLGTTTFHKIGLRHSFVTRVFSEFSIDQQLIFRPISIPGP